jgi:hypothetical protein
MWRLSLALETIDGWDVTVTGGATVTCLVGKLNFLVPYNADPNYYAVAYAPTKTILCNRKIHTRMLFETAYAYAGYTAYICAGLPSLAMTGNTAAGFKIVDGVLFAYHKEFNLGDPVEHLTEVMNLASNTFYNLEMIYTPSTSIEFYVDDVLVATHTEEMPPEALGFGGAFYTKMTNNTTGTKGFSLYSPYIQQEI